MCAASTSSSSTRKWTMTSWKCGTAQPRMASCWKSGAARSYPRTRTAPSTSSRSSSTATTSSANPVSPSSSPVSNSYSLLAPFSCFLSPGFITLVVCTIWNSLCSFFPLVLEQTPCQKKIWHSWRDGEVGGLLLFRNAAEIIWTLCWETQIIAHLEWREALLPWMRNFVSVCHSSCLSLKCTTLIIKMYLYYLSYNSHHLQRPRHPPKRHSLRGQQRARWYNFLSVWSWLPGSGSVWDYLRSAQQSLLLAARPPDMRR